MGALTNIEVTAGIAPNGDVRLIVIGTEGNTTSTMSPDAARHTARELLAAADRGDAILVAIRARNAGTTSEAKP